jgi:muconolactone D-isomerase
MGQFSWARKATTGHQWSLFDAEDVEQLETVLSSMPLRVWRRDTVTPLGRHPN